MNFLKSKSGSMLCHMHFLVGCQRLHFFAIGSKEELFTGVSHLCGNMKLYNTILVSELVTEVVKMSKSQSPAVAWKLNEA